MNRLISLCAVTTLVFGTTAAFSADPALDQGTENSMEFSFDQLDTNGDGQLSREEAAAAGLNLDWGRADLDSSGSLSREEYDSAIRGGSGNEGGGSGIDNDTGGGVDGDSTQ